MHSSCSLTSNESPWILIARRRGTTATTEPEKMTQISQSMSVPLTSHVMWNPNSSAYLFWIFNGRCQWYQQIDGKITICHHFPIIFPSFSQDFSTSPCPLLRRRITAPREQPTEGQAPMSMSKFHRDQSFPGNFHGKLGLLRKIHEDIGKG